MPRREQTARDLRARRKGGRRRAEVLTAEERSKIARMGCEAANANRTPEERSDLARRAAEARWAKTA